MPTKDQAAAPERKSTEWTTVRIGVNELEMLSEIARMENTSTVAVLTRLLHKGQIAREVDAARRRELARLQERLANTG